MPTQRMSKAELARKLKQLGDVPFEQWSQHGVYLSAVSSNSKVQSGITRDGHYFYRKWHDPPHFTSSTLVVAEAGP